MIGRLRELIHRGHLLVLVLQDGRPSLSTKLLALLGLGWVLSPFDFDFVPLLGWLDDALVVTVVSGMVQRRLPDGVAADLAERDPPPLRRVMVGVLFAGAIAVAAMAALLWWLVV